MNQTINFLNISCPCCAEKIRKSVENLSYIKSAELDFPAGKINISMSGEGDFITDIKKIASNLEPDAEFFINGEIKKPQKIIFRFTLPLIHFGLIAIAMILRNYPVISTVLITVCFIWAAYPVAIKAFSSLKNRNGIDEDFLMLIASIGAMAIGKYYEAVAVLLLNEIGELLEGLASERSRRSITETMELRPEYACVVRDGVELNISPEKVNIGDILIVRPGERVPIDGIVIGGSSSLDTAALTGESIPKAVYENDEIISGCVNIDGTLRIKAMKSYSDSAVSKIMKLTDEARKHKAKTESLITRFAKYYTPAVMSIAFLICTVPLLFGGEPSVWIYRGLTLLVVSCPCALVISVPMAYFAGMGGSAKRGIIVRGGKALDALAQCDTFVFDKTGTLTAGVFDIAEIIPVGISKKELLHYCASAEAGSNHPLAKSLREAYPASPPKDAVEIAGRGISAKIDGKTVLCGNIRLLTEAGINPPIAQKGTSIYCAIDGVYAGCIRMTDRLKFGAKEAISNLKNIGINRFKVLSGDSPDAVAHTAAEAGINEFTGGLLPDGKLNEVSNLIDNGAKVAFVGDGINDAPVLTLAHAGIAMGVIGSDAAVEAADIVIMNDDLALLPSALTQARKTRSTVRVNIAFALTVKAVVLILASIGLCGMWAAVIADTGVSLLAVMNSARLIKGSK